jgi:peroxiredoxin
MPTNFIEGMPGAYTKVCSAEHMPGYLSAAPEFKSLGVDNIVVMTTNDRHVNEAWGTTYGFASESKPPITIVSDGDGDLAKTMGLADDMGFGVGVRSKRFAMVVKDGVVSTLLTDEGMNDCDQTSAQNLLRVIRPESSIESSEGEISGALVGGAAVVVLGLLLAMNPLGGGGGQPVTSTPTPKVQVQPPKAEKAKSFSLLNEYL